jgi:hypothetical protein
MVSTRTFLRAGTVRTTTTRDESNNVSGIRMNAFSSHWIAASETPAFAASSLKETYLEIDGPLVEENTIYSECLAQIRHWSRGAKGRS